MHTPSRRRFLSHLSGAACLPLLGACAAPSPTAAPVAAQPPRTAMLLPLSGPQAALGQTMAKAVWLVEDSRGLPQRVEIFDTGPTPAGAAGAARLADGMGAEVIVGPLFSDHTAAVMSAAPKAQVISLSNDDGLAASGAWVFGVTPAQSAEAAAAFARQAGLGSISMLQPEGAFGTRSAEALGAAAKTHRLKMMPPVPAGQSGDLAGALRTAGGGAMPDGLYLPAADAPSRAAARAASRAGLAVIGSLQWADASPEMLRGIGTMRFAGPDPALFNGLSARYRTELGEEMGIISGLAVDAVLLANSLPRDRHGKVQMTGGAPMDGLLGQCAFRKDRTCARRLAMLQVRDGQVTPVG